MKALINSFFAMFNNAAAALATQERPKITFEKCPAHNDKLINVITSGYSVAQVSCVYSSELAS
jgi:hypothetical protein